MTDNDTNTALDALSALCVREGVRLWDQVRSDGDGPQAVWSFGAGRTPSMSYSAGEFGVPLGPEAQMLGTLRIMKAFADDHDMTVLRKETRP